MTEPADPSRLAALIEQIEDLIDPRAGGLPEELFLFASRITPLVNVDLLIQDERKRTLLTWRDDSFYGPGWHVPGGIIRHAETAADRVCAVARLELATTVTLHPTPILVQESVEPERRDRSHHISLLYLCRLTGSLDPLRKYTPEAPQPDQWFWHECCPENLIPEQQAYGSLMG